MNLSLGAGHVELESRASMCSQLESTVTIYSLQSRSPCALEQAAGVWSRPSHPVQSSAQHPRRWAPCPCSMQSRAPSPPHAVPWTTLTQG